MIIGEENGERKAGRMRPSYITSNDHIEEMNTAMDSEHGGLSRLVHASSVGSPMFHSCLMNIAHCTALAVVTLCTSSRSSHHVVTEWRGR